MIKFQQSDVLTSHFESFWSIVQLSIVYKIVNVQVHEYMVECNDKENEDVMFPTTKILHKKIQEIEGIPKWSFTTSYRILLALGFR